MEKIDIKVKVSEAMSVLSGLIEILKPYEKRVAELESKETALLSKIQKLGDDAAFIATEIEHKKAGIQKFIDDESEKVSKVKTRLPLLCRERIAMKLNRRMC